MYYKAMWPGYSGVVVIEADCEYDARIIAFKRFVGAMSKIIIDLGLLEDMNGEDLPPTRKGDPAPIFIRQHPAPVEEINEEVE